MSIQTFSDNAKITDDQIPGKGADPRTLLDPIGTKMHNSLNGLYYYYLEEGLFNTTVVSNTYDNTSVLGTTDAIVNIGLSPFLNLSASNLKRKVFDTGRFGTVMNIGSVPVNDAPYLFRINSDFGVPRMEIATAKVYNIKKPEGFPVKRSSSYESKLQEYPYRSIIFASNVFDEIEIIPRYCRDNEDFKNSGSVSLSAYTPINPNGNFFLSIKGGYRGDKYGIMERVYSTNSFDMPNTSSAYSNYISTQKAMSVSNAAVSAATSGVNAAVQIQRSTIERPTRGQMFNQLMNRGDLSGIQKSAKAIALVPKLAAASAVVDVAGTIANSVATEQVARRTPNALRSTGGDVSVRLGYQHTISDTTGYNARVIVGEKTVNSTTKEKLGSYFHMFGYAQNRVMKIDLRARHFFNYIKTVGANVSGRGIPKKYLEEIKSVYDNGVTFWHVDRQYVTVGDYQYDNSEISFTGGI